MKPLPAFTRKAISQEQPSRNPSIMIHCSKVSRLNRDHGIVVPVGTVDADYRGEIGVTVYNLSREPYEIKPGDRIAQLVISPCVRAKWEEVESLNATGRNGGFGSTGK